MEENKELDDFIRRSIKAAGLEKPSVDFTDSVLSKIKLANEQESVMVTKPLFSKTTWFLILAAVVAVFSYVFMAYGKYLVGSHRIE